MTIVIDKTLENKTLKILNVNDDAVKVEWPL